MPGSEYGDIPFADDIKAMIDLLDEKILSLTTTIASLETDLEEYGFAFLFKQWKYVASNVLLKSSDAVKETNNTSWTLAKTIPFNSTPTISTKTSKFRIKFEMRLVDLGARINGRIYRNGEPVGTDHGTTSGEWQLYSQDIDNWEPDDNIQLYYKCLNSAYTGAVKNFRVYGDLEGVVYPEPSW